MRSRTRFWIFLLMLAVILQSACITTPLSITSSTTPLQDKKTVMNYGPVQGSHKAWSVFGLWMIGRPDIDKAIQEALKQKGGDALINVTCYEKTIWFFFASSHTVVVEGEAVSLEAASTGSDKGNKPVKGQKKQ
jgi:hypothetical protein